MAISIEQTTKEKIQAKKFTFPLWAIWLLILVIISGTIIYFLFIKKSPEGETVSYKASSNVLSREDLDKFQEIIKTLQGSPFKYLKKTIPDSFFASPPKSKVGKRSNPFK